MYCRVKTLFVVAAKSSLPIIELNSSKQLNLIKRIFSISNSQGRDFLDEYKDLVKFPRALPNKLKLQLERTQRLDILEPVNEPTEWVNPLIIPEKPNGKLRICLDPKHGANITNFQSQKSVSPKCIASIMHNFWKITKLHACSGYWQTFLNIFWETSI